MKKIILITLMVLSIGCNSKKDEFKYGTFDLYENDTVVGTIYRMNNFQLEKYLDNSEVLARIDYKTDSTYLISGIEKNQIGIDTIIWLNTFKKINRTKYEITAEPFNSDIKYEYEGIMVRTNDEIEKIYIDTLNYLNKNFKKINQ